MEQTMKSPHWMPDFEAIAEAKMKYLEMLTVDSEIADTLDFKRGRVSLWAGGMKNGPLGRWPTEEEYQERLKKLQDRKSRI
jgi:hypothetical protein